MEISHPLALTLSDRAQNLTLPLTIDTKSHSLSTRLSSSGSLPSSGSDVSSPDCQRIPRMNLNSILNQHHVLSMEHSRALPLSISTIPHQLIPRPHPLTSRTLTTQPLTPLAVNINNNLISNPRDHLKQDVPVFPGLPFMTSAAPDTLTPETSPSVSGPLTPASTNSSLSPISSSNSLPSPRKDTSPMRVLPSMQDVMFNTALQGFVGQTAATPLTTSAPGLPTTPNAALVAAAAAAAMASRGQGQTSATLPGMLPNTPPSSLLPQSRNELMSQAMNNVYAMWGPGSAIAHAMAISQQGQMSAGSACGPLTPGGRRPRSEKKAIPDNQKDDKYYERRKRNNNAAKKSRDSRKAREDEIAIRASFLEKENAILRAQVGTLREEANSLRQLLLQKRSR